MGRLKVTPDEPERRTEYGPSGGEKGMKLQRYDLIPVAPLEEVAKVYGTGASKYADRNWERGYEWSKSYASLQRHVQAFWDGESIDVGTEVEPGTMRHHLANTIFHAMALMEFELKGLGEDDRPSSSSQDADADDIWDGWLASGRRAWEDYYGGLRDTPTLEDEDEAEAEADWDGWLAIGRRVRKEYYGGLRDAPTLEELEDEADAKRHRGDPMIERTWLAQQEFGATVRPWRDEVEGWHDELS